MPICPRCGKCLSSDQALTYHLNRKYRCGTWKCTKCQDLFNTKFHLQMHELNCINETDDVPTVEYLLKIYTHFPHVILNLDKDDMIINASPNVKRLLCKDIKDLKNKPFNDLKLNHDLDYDVLYEDNNERIVMIKKL